ncbi:MAG: sugar transferase [Candidatus Omnitrophota bacterium]
MRSKSKNPPILFIYILIDVYIASLCIFAACLFRQETLTFPVEFQRLFSSQSNPFQILFLSWIFFVVIFNNLFGLYQTRRELMEGIELWMITKSVFLSSLGVVSLQYILKIQEFPRSIFLISIALIILSFFLWRVIKRLFVEYLVAQGYNNFNAIIVGAGKVGVALAQEITSRPGLGIKIVGFLDDFKKDDPADKHMRIIGKISDFSDIAKKRFIDKVFITVHHDSSVFLKLLEDARDLGVAVRVIPQGFELTSGDFSRYNIGFIPVLEYENEFNARKQTGKRLFDFAVGLITLIILLPVFLLIGIMIKLDSPGPIFYSSRRYGKKGEMFYMYKFRSMVKEADLIMNQIKCKNEVDGPIFKMKKDPRITKVGSFLRKYSLDELPQLLNVLKGEMSLVGPRPLPIDQVEKEDFKQLKRLEVRPGMTGLWQIRGRSDIAFSRLVKWDIWYINNWSFWLDINILLQTIPAILKGQGAY